MLSNELQVTCPYCNEQFPVPEPENLGAPFEIECVPYTRDIGRFDPASKSEWLSPDGWTRIGKDFFKLLNWEHIGILRIRRRGINIQYRVQHCQSCEFPFDVYANYTKTSFKELWPHLFGAEPGKPIQINPYRGKSWEIWFIDLFSKFTKSRIVSAIIIGLLILGFGLSPWFFRGDISFNSGIPVEFFLTLVLYGIASIGIIVNLIIKDRYVHYLAETVNFRKLFQVSETRGVVHWQNYTLCRFVGVQEFGRFPNITQVDVVGGGLSLVALLVIWCIIKLGAKLLLYFWSSVLVIALILVGLVIVTRKNEESKFLRHLLKILFPILPLIPVAFVLYQMQILEGTSVLSNIHTVVDLFFWAMIVYFLGTATWQAMDSTLYVLEGIKRLPMNLTPYDNFSKAKPLKKLQTFSTSTMVVIFLTVLGIIASITVFSQPQFITEVNNAAKEFNWVFIWLQWALAFMLAFIGFAVSGKPYFIWITIFYIIITLLFSELTVEVSIFAVDGTVIAFGIFFTIVLLYQVLGNKKIVTGILREVKNKTIAELEEHIEEIRTKLSNLKNQKTKCDTLSEQEKFLIEQKSLVGTLNDLVRLHKHVNEVKLQPITAYGWIQLLSPFVMSVILPGLLDKFFDRILKLITR